MVKILNCCLYAKKSFGTLSKGAIFFLADPVYFISKHAISLRKDILLGFIKAKIRPHFHSQNLRNELKHIAKCYCNI